MKLIIGLGNPGKKYEKTRHNAGYLVIDELAQSNEIALKNKRGLFGEVGTGTVNGENIVLLKPTTFMNLSGKAVRAVMDFYKIAVPDILMVLDDADLEFGTLRLKDKGSSAGHKGAGSVIETLGTQNFSRLRIGIGRPENENVPLEDYVLSVWSEKEEQETLPGAIRQAAEKVLEWLKK